MPPSLFEPDLKRQWANKHLETLKTTIESFVQNHPYQILGEEDFEASQYVIKILHPNLLEALPTVLALGDFVTCLRSSLDWLAWQLCLLGGDWPTRANQFPIFDKNTVDTQIAIAKATFGIPEAAISIMKSLQPYNSGNDFKSTHLWRLSMLCNIDKHRHISAFRPVPPWQVRFSGELAHPEWNIIREQVDNCTVMRVPLATKDHVDFNPDRGIEFRFFDKREGIDIGYQDLIEMYDFVATKVIPAFSSFFP